MWQRQIQRLSPRPCSSSERERLRVVHDDRCRSSRRAAARCASTAPDTAARQSESRPVPRRLAGRCAWPWSREERIVAADELPVGDQSEIAQQRYLRTKNLGDTAAVRRRAHVQDAGFLATGEPARGARRSRRRRPSPRSCRSTANRRRHSRALSSQSMVPPPDGRSPTNEPVTVLLRPGSSAKMHRRRCEIGTELRERVDGRAS